MENKRLESLSQNLKEMLDDDKASALITKYKDSFSGAYEEKFSPKEQALDIIKIQEAIENKDISIHLYKPENCEQEGTVCLKGYNHGSPIILSDIIPMLEHISFRILSEIPYECKFEGEKVWIHDFTLVRMDGSQIDIDCIKDTFEDAFLNVWNGKVDDDGFNCLVLQCGVSWREVEVLRAYARYLRQVGINLSQDYINSALAANPSITRLLVDYFHYRFDPKKQNVSKEKAKETAEKIKEKLEKVVSADEDRIVRYFLNLMGSTLRTNFYQKDENGNYKECISFKIDSSKVYDLPLPKPMVEIYVFSSRVEAIHLRGGKVARGGLRWSDRPEDFRTEILGLMKAQQVKNVVIIPVGSKGGFVVKRPPKNASREEFQAEGIRCYKTFIRGLLDITDNISGEKIINPKDVVRYDEDDPYLVVAADKGTATFSDIANGVSKEYDFWLGDAFASGGSVGYDHKGMGITARGAWESVKRHFREMGHNTQTTDFRVVGVGDMGGDVFGNGMLLSKHIRLVAAFNHMHIFLDPNPDAKKSWEERKRLFELPRSTWDDYDKELISKGGGVFSRKEKNIPLTPEVKEMLDLDVDKISPNELIQAILKAKTDLLWFGGIGTYVKSSDERNSDVGDRANDVLRVNAIDVQAQVVGEGANLGMTQKARIELPGRCFTDAIDNSAGVDCSDHEVNIKILLNKVVEDGKLSVEERNKLLADMTDEVAELVLEDNYLQTQALSVMLAQGTCLISEQKRLFRLLEERGQLNRDVEFLPSNDEMDERAAVGECLTRPELAILMPYSKIWLYDAILDSDLTDDPMLDEVLIKYFPTPLREKYKDYMYNHPLKKEIIATQITNSLINRVGGTFVTSLREKTAMRSSVIARAFTIARIAFDICDVWDEIESLDNQVDSSVQTDMLIEVNRILERITLWILRNGPKRLDLGNVIKDLKQRVEMVSDCLEEALLDIGDRYLSSQSAKYINKGVPESTAKRVAGLALLSSSLDIGDLVKKYDYDALEVTKTYFKLGRKFEFSWIWDATSEIEESSHWEHLALSGMQEATFAHQRELTANMLSFLKEKGVKKGYDVEEQLNAWLEENKTIVDRLEQLIKELKTSTNVDLAMMMVLSRSFRAITQIA